MMLIIASTAAAYGLAALAVVAATARREAPLSWRSEAIFWALICLLCLLFIAGAVPWFWQLPFLAKVQFPWRLMILVEFAAITALCLVPWPARSRWVSYSLIVAVVAFLPAGVLMAMGLQLRIEMSRGHLKQFLPAGYPQKPDGGYAELSLGPVEGLPTIACAPAPRTCRADKQRFGALRIEVDAEQPTAVVVRRFAYPFWRLAPPLPVGATEPLQLVAFTAPAGRGTYLLERIAVPQERVGMVISSLSLVLLLGWAISARNSARRGKP
jgi:hypothetical protein